MIQNRERMAHFASLIHGMNPRLAPSDHIMSQTRENLEGFAMASGMMTSLVGRATAKDLIGVYLVGRKDPIAVTRTIRQVEGRMSNGAGPLAPEPPPYAPPEPPLEPPTRPSMGFTREERETIRNIAENALTTALAPSLDAFSDAIRADMDSRLERSEKRVDDTLAFAVNSLRDTVRQEAATAVQSALKAMAPTVLVVKTPNAPTGVNLGLVHKTTPRVIRYLAAGNNVYLHGPAGSGKTTAASQCAEAFGLEFYFTGKVDSEYSLLGFTTGPVVVRTPFREAFEKGGLFLFDEMDKSDASALVAVNAALANGVCAFPDGIIKRHENFKVIGGGNANLTGQSRLYQASQQMDASSIDRFDFIEFLYDEELERALSTDAKWCAYVQAVRRAVAERGLDHLVTPRATIGGCKLLAAGEPWNEVAEAVIYKGLDKSTVDQLEAMVKGAY